ncbi:hypothetical protein L7F22_057323, partial [Adiantum nelumboides]|nr:hypothetical protein [Adiantum nelumboides]
MSKEHDISPTQEHHRCMADLLSRTGNLVEADEYMRKTCLKPVAHRSLLSASQNFGSIDFAKVVFECALEDTSGNSVVLEESSKALGMST